MADLIIDCNDQGRIFISFPYRPDIIEAIKTIPSRQWDKNKRVHWISKYDIDPVIRVFESFNYNVKFNLNNPLLNKYFEKKGTLNRIKNLPWTTEQLAKLNESIKLKLPLRPFQVVGKEFLINAKSCLLADDMGLGKTIEVISTFMALREGMEVNKMMVLCPSSVKGSWAKDIEKFTDLKYQIIEGTRAAREKLYQNEYDIVIMSYDVFLMDFGISEKRAQSGKAMLPLPKIDMLAADECQRLVKIKNKTTQSLHILKEKLQLKHIYLMTGTPIVNKVEDIWSLLYFIEPELVGEFWQFRSRYCEIEYEEIKMLDRKKLKEQGVYEKIVRKIPHVVGYKNLDELKIKIDPFYIRREKKEVLKDLPDKIYETYEIELKKNQRDLYEEAKRDFLNRFQVPDEESNPVNVLTWLVKAKEICDSSELYDISITDSSKLDELKEILKDLVDDNNHKCVIFSQYKMMTDILCRELNKYKPLYLHGGVKSEDRQLLIDTFQSDSQLQYKLFISTLGAGGTGITLTAAGVCILYDKWWSPSQNNQAVDRLHRIGQEHESVLVIDFKCIDTIEERVEKILERKKQIFDSIFDEKELLGKLTLSELKSLF